MKENEDISQNGRGEKIVMMDLLYHQGQSPRDLSRMFDMPEAEILDLILKRKLSRALEIRLFQRPPFNIPFRVMPPFKWGKRVRMNRQQIIRFLLDHGVRVRVNESDGQMYESGNQVDDDAILTMANEIAERKDLPEIYTKKGNHHDPSQRNGAMES